MADEPGQKTPPELDALGLAKSQIRRNMNRRNMNFHDLQEEAMTAADAVPKGYAIPEGCTARDQVVGEEKLAIAEDAPIIQLVRGVGLAADEGGQFIRVKVETLTQGEVVLHIEMPMVNELISMLSAGRFHAERFAAAIGKSTPRAIMPVQSFATGACLDGPASGVVMILNQGTPAESLHLLPNAQAVRDIAKSLARDADQVDLRSRGVIAPGTRKNALLGPNGVPINPVCRTQ
jgi:hypothetical protein